MRTDDSSVRQRQQGRDAAQLARRRACRACSTRCASCLDAGVAGITVHPRADERHITPRGRPRRSRASCADGGRRSSSTSRAIRGPICSRWCTRSGPTSARSCRSCPGEITSQAGWTPGTADRRRSAAVDRRPAARAGIRVSLFVDPEPDGDRAGPRRSGADRVELYTEPFARAFERGADAARRRSTRYAAAARLARVARPRRQRRARSRPRQPPALPRAAAPGRGVDRPRAHVHAPCSSASRPCVREYLAVLATMPACRRRSSRTLQIAVDARSMIQSLIMKSESDRVRRRRHRCSACIAGWIIGSQQASVRSAAGAARRGRAGRRRRRAAGAPAPPSLDEAKVSALKRDRREASRRTPRPRVELGNLYFDAERYDDAIQWYEEALKLEPEGRRRQHRPRRQLLLHEPAGPGARAVRRSRCRSIRSTRRRC